MEVHIEWKKYGNLRDVAVFGEFKGEFGNDPPFTYATAVARDKYVAAFQGVKDWLRTLHEQGGEESREKAKKLEDYIGWRDFQKLPKHSNLTLPVLLYIGISTTTIEERMESFDPGVSIPVYVLDIPATEINVFIGFVDKPLSAKGNYDDLEKALVYKYQPLLNIHYKKTPPPVSFQFVH